MNTSSVPMPDSVSTDAITPPPPVQQLPVPVPDWSRSRQVWNGCWPAHVYGFGCAFLIAAALSLASPPCCFRCRRTTLATSTVNGIVGVVCFSQSCVLLIDAYHSTGRLPVALVQVVPGLVFPGVVSTLTILDRVFSALVKPRQQLGSIKHPRLIATALSVYLLSTLVAHAVIAVKPQTRLWLLLCQAVSLTWGCAAVFLVACQCLRLARYANLTARSRRQTAMYIRAKRHVEQRLDASPNSSERRYELLRHLARLRVARTKADEFAQQQRMSGLNEQTVSDADIQMEMSSTSDSSDQMPSDLRVTKTTTVKLSSHNHFRYHRRSRRRRRVTGSSSAAYGGSEAVRDFTVTALAAARLLWSPSPDSDGCCDESPSWHVCLHTTDHPDGVDHPDVCVDKRRSKPHNATTQLDRHTSITGTDSYNDDVDNDREETDSSSGSRQRPCADTANMYGQSASANLQNISETGRCGYGVATRSDETRASTTCGQQSEPTTSFGDSRRASSRTCLLLDNASNQPRPILSWRSLSWRLTSVTTRLLRQAVTRWRKSRNLTSSPRSDEPSRYIACVAESYRLDTTCSYASRLLDVESESKSSSTSTTDRRRQRASTYDAVIFENRAYNSRYDVAGCDEAVDSVVAGTSSQITPALGVADDCRQASSGYLADTELDNVDCKHDPDASTTSSLQLPASAIYLGLSRLRGGRTVRLVWRTACAAVTSACVVCCLHIYSMLGVFGVLSNDRPASAWPWLGFQTLCR